MMSSLCADDVLSVISASAAGAAAPPPPGPRYGSNSVGSPKLSPPSNCDTDTERVQALADISRSALCCHSNENRAPIANPPNSVQLEAPLPFPNLHLGPCSSVGMRRGTDIQTHRRA